MATLPVRFRYLTGLKRRIFRNVRLCGTWDGQGRLSQNVTETPMAEITAEDGFPGFTATVQFDESEVDKSFQWYVRLDAPAAPDIRGITTEICDPFKTDRVRTFKLKPADSNQIEDFYFTYARRMGARKVFTRGRSGKPGLRFAVWAPSLPNTQKVEVVFGDPSNGYISDDDYGIDASRPPLPMTKDDATGIWESDVIPGGRAH